MSSNVLTLITVWRLFKFAAEAPVSADALVGVAVWIWRSEDLTQNTGRCSCSHPVSIGILRNPLSWIVAEATSPTGLLAPAESVFLRL